MTQYLKKLTPEYLAGFIDGEGCISIYRMNTSRGRIGTWQPRLTIVNTNEEIIRDIKEEFGGSLQLKKRKNVAHKIAYQISLYGKTCEKVLRWILPHLRLKRAQAILAIELRDITQHPFAHRRFTQDDIDMREALRLAITKLNRRGVAHGN